MSSTICDHVQSEVGMHGRMGDVKLDPKESYGSATRWAQSFASCIELYWLYGVAPYENKSADMTTNCFWWLDAAYTKH